MPRRKKDKEIKKGIEEGGRFEVFFQGTKKFLTPSAAHTFLDHDSPDEGIVARLRAHPRGCNLPDLFRGDSFTVDNQNYIIEEVFWGYKDWVNMEVFGFSSQLVAQQNRSTASTVAFVVLSLA